MVLERSENGIKEDVSRKNGHNVAEKMKIAP